MTDPVVSSYPGYASLALVNYEETAERSGWIAIAQPMGQQVGVVQHYDAGWTALTLPDLHHLGLYPDKQAAGEALVKHAGYEVLR